MLVAVIYLEGCRRFVECHDRDGAVILECTTPEGTPYALKGLCPRDPWPAFWAENPRETVAQIAGNMKYVKPSRIEYNPRALSKV